MTYVFDDVTSGEAPPSDEFRYEPQIDHGEDTCGSRTDHVAALPRQRANGVREVISKLDLRAVFLRMMGLAGLSPSPYMESRTSGHRSMQHHELRDERELVNGRRLHLIEREYRDGLSSQEQVELERLQETASTHVAARFPLPWGQLEALEQAADHLPRA